MSKKTLSLLCLAMLCIIAITAAFATTPSDLCSHESTYTNYSGDYSYTDDPESGMHLVTAITYEQVICDVCGEIVSDTSTTEEYLDSHAWINGVCEKCGAVCNHNETTTDTSYDWDSFTYEDNTGSNTHTVHRVQKHVTRCTSCGSVLDEYEENIAEVETHWYDENGVCQECGHVCLHDGRTWEEVTYEYTDCIDNRDGTHTLNSGIKHTVVRCGLCYFVIESKDEAIIGEVQAHKYDRSWNAEKVCLGCGHPCEHTDTYVNHGYGGTFQDNGDGTHTFTGEYESIVTCRDCSKQLSTTTEETTVVEAHWFYNPNLCDACGLYCEHSSTQPGPTVVYEEILRISETAHTCTTCINFLVKYVTLAIVRCKQV